MKIEVGKKYKASSGEIFYLVYISEKGSVVLENDVGVIVSITKENLLNNFSEYTEPEKLSGWINVYTDTNKLTKEEADREAKVEETVTGNKRLACIDLSKIDVDNT